MLPGLRASVADSRAKAAATRKRKAATWQPADVDPVARVLLDLPLAHLDRPYDYGVPHAMAQSAQPGVRVKVRFGGQDVDGFVLERRADTDHTGTLQPLRRVVGSESVLSPAVAALCEEVAQRWAGVRADVLRLAIPPRHATTEADPSPPSPPFERPDALVAAQTVWRGHDFADAWLEHVAARGAPRAVWGAAPGTDWPDLIAHAAAVALASGRGTLVVVPDARDVVRVSAALSRVLGPDQHVELTASSGPAQRYADFLAISRGARKVVVGTRAAAYAPVTDLGLVVLWDDGDEQHAEPRAPYAHARDVLLLRAAAETVGLLIGGFARSVEAQHLVTTGWAHEIAAGRHELRSRARVEVAGASDFDLERDPLARISRLPRQAHQAILEALRSGPVLVHSPRAGYAASLACERCRTPARCTACTGPLQIGGPTQPPSCRWCGLDDQAWQCAVCRGRGLRAPILGEARTVEELGRMFPTVTVRSSSGDHVIDAVPDRPALVVATPGAEPHAEGGGFAAVVLLDTWLALGRVDLRTEEEALRRWQNAAGLVRAGGHVLVVGDAAHPAIQALVRWDPAGFATREAVLRSEAHLPPAVRLATISGDPGAVDDALTLLTLPAVAEVLGPVPVQRRTSSGVQEELRAVVRVPRASAGDLSAALAELQRVRSARKLDPVRVQVDPPTL